MAVAAAGRSQRDPAGLNPAARCRGLHVLFPGERDKKQTLVRTLRRTQKETPRTYLSLPRGDPACLPACPAVGDTARQQAAGPQHTVEPAWLQKGNKGGKKPLPLSRNTAHQDRLLPHTELPDRPHTPPPPLRTHRPSAAHARPAQGLEGGPAVHEWCAAPASGPPRLLFPSLPAFLLLAARSERDRRFLPVSRCGGDRSALKGKRR